MRVSKIGLFASLTLPVAASLVAYSLGSVRVDRPRQSSPQAAAQPPSQAPAESSQQQTGPARPRRQTPCWRLAGIPSALVNQRWHIEDNAKGKIGAVCTDPTLSAEKKRAKIQEINEQTEQEIAKIIPAKQLETFKACETERDQEKAKLQAARGEKELGPCGGVIPAQPGTSQHPHEHQPSNPPKQ